MIVTKEKRSGAAAARERRNVLYLVSAAAFLGPFSQSIYTPSIVAIKDSFATSYMLVMATISVFSFVLAIAQLVYGPIVDAFSGRRVLLVGIAVYGFASLLAYFAPTVEVLIAIRALQGFGVATASVVGATFIADLFGADERARAMGFFQMSVAIGMVVGPVAGSAIAGVFDWRTSFLWLVACACAIFALVRGKLPDLRPTGRQAFAPTNALQVIKLPATLGTALLSFVQQYSLATFASLLAVLLAKPGFDLGAGWVGPLLVPFTVGVALGTPMGGRVADRRGRRRAIRLGTAAAAVCSGLFALITLMTPSRFLLLPLMATMACLGFSLGFNWPGQLALMVEWFPRMRGTAVGVYNFIRFAGSTLGALLGGYIVDHYGVSNAFVVVFLLLLLGVVISQTLVAEASSAT